MCLQVKELEVQDLERLIVDKDREILDFRKQNDNKEKEKGEFLLEFLILEDRKVELEKTVVLMELEVIYFFKK